MSKGFTLIEVLIVLVIFAIVISLAIPAYESYSHKIRVEGETHKVYLILKDMQLKARTQKVAYCADLTDGGKSLTVYNDTACTSVVESFPLAVEFALKDATQKLKVNRFGIFTVKNSVYAVNGEGASVNCVKADSFRLCEGVWDETARECECKF
jgi:prepilin-type N-terminal cleavage/methylation domain-containing protein